MKILTQKMIAAELRKLGLEAGDHIIVHSALSSLGQVEGGADAVIDALLEVVGPEGTLVFPTFANTGVFDINKSKTGLGAIPSAALKRRSGVRSRHPLASVVAFGKKAAWLTKHHDRAPTAHGEGTPYMRLCELNGKIVLIGVDQDRNTFFHSAEALAKLPYLKTKSAAYRDENGKEVMGKWAYFPGPHRNFIGLQARLEQLELTRKIKIGGALVQVMAMPPLLEQLREMLAKEPGLFISHNPNLPDGLWQHAAIKKNKLKNQTFTVAADSASAGRYTEEIIDNLHRCGIGHVVLSYSHDQPWGSLEENQRKWHLQGLRSAEIKIAALRLNLWESAPILGLLKQAGVNRVILPSTTPLATLHELGRARVEVEIENTAMSGEAVTQMLLRSRGENLPIAAAFNPLHFAQMGELPFLQTYQKKIRRFVRTLIVNDGLATGKRTALEGGLAEIKELISILSCASFDGLFLLESESPEKFGETAEKFYTMLEELGL